MITIYDIERNKYYCYGDLGGEMEVSKAEALLIDKRFTGDKQDKEQDEIIAIESLADGRTMYTYKSGYTAITHME